MAQSKLSEWSLLSWHPTHTYLWGRLCFVQIVCSPLSRTIVHDVGTHRLVGSTLLVDQWHHQILDVRLDSFTSLGGCWTATVWNRNENASRVQLRPSTPRLSRNGKVFAHVCLHEPYPEHSSHEYVDNTPDSQQVFQRERRRVCHFPEVDATWPPFKREQLAIGRYPTVGGKWVHRVLPNG